MGFLELLVLCESDDALSGPPDSTCGFEEGSISALISEKRHDDDVEGVSSKHKLHKKKLLRAWSAGLFTVAKVTPRGILIKSLAQGER